MMAERIHQLVQDMPQPVVERLASVLAGSAIDKESWASLRIRVAQTIPQPDLRQKVMTFLQAWQYHDAEVGVDVVVLAMLTAARTAHHYRHAQQLDMVWTGPDSQVIPLRRNDQALLQLIDEAQETLHIVSFAVYKIQAIHDAILRAVKRGVKVSLYVEDALESGGKVSTDARAVLGEWLFRQARVYVWAREKRPLDEKGRFGSLHAKVALADGRLLLISSANLTGHAMTLNMEMGVLIRGGREPQQVESHLLRLIEQEVFVPL